MRAHTVGGRQEHGLLSGRIVKRYFPYDRCLEKSRLYLCDAPETDFPVSKEVLLGKDGVCPCTYVRMIFLGQGEQHFPQVYKTTCCMCVSFLANRMFSGVGMPLLKWAGAECKRPHSMRQSGLPVPKPASFAVIGPLMKLHSVWSPLRALSGKPAQQCNRDHTYRNGPKETFGLPADQ